MTRTKILNGPTRLSDMSFDDYYDSGEDLQQDKTHRLQIRRWRRMKQQLL